MPAHFHFQYQIKAQPAFVPLPPFPSYFQALSLPVRQRQINTALMAPSHAWNPSTPAEIITVDKWFKQPVDPIVKSKARLIDGAQLFFTASPLPIIPSHGWFVNFVDPVRFKPGLGAHLHGPPAFDPLPFPASGRPIEWFQALSEPVRIKPGLHASLHMFLTEPSRVIAGGSVTLTLNAVEFFDSLLAGLRSYNAVFSADVGVTEVRRTISPVSIIENIQKFGNVSIGASLPVTSFGSAVAPVASARVAIQEV